MLAIAILDVQMWHILSFGTHTHTHNRLTAFCPGLPGTWVDRYQKKHSPTHTHPISSSSIYNDPWHPRVEFTSLTVLSDNLSPGPLWSSSWPWTLNFILHAFLHPIIIIFSQHMPIPTQPVLLQYQCYVVYT